MYKEMRKVCMFVVQGFINYYFYHGALSTLLFSFYTFLVGGCHRKDSINGKALQLSNPGLAFIPAGTFSPIKVAGK